MTTLIKGNRIGSKGKISVGCSATIFTDDRNKILLTKRVDNLQWCLPGGKIEPGETISETCLREVLEETGFEILIKRLIGVYSSPNIIVKYSDGNEVQIVGFNFEAEIISGEFQSNEEVNEIRYFSKEEINEAEIFEIHKERILDAMQNFKAIVIK